METKSETLTFAAQETKSGNGILELGTVSHNGKDFTNSGAFYDGKYAVAYLREDAATHRCTVYTWDGKLLGNARIVGTWRNPFSNMISSHTHQVEACIDGVFYTGRSAGNGMIWKGKRKAKQIFSR